MKILDVRIDEVDLAAAYEKISGWLNNQEQKQVTTINPEFMVAAQKNRSFKTALNQSALNTADGIGLIWLGGGKLKRVTGVDLTQKLLTEAKAAKFYLLGSNDQIIESLKNKYPQARIVGGQGGGKIDDQTCRLAENEKVIAAVRKSGANILLVAFGGTKQEIWINQNLNKMPNIKVAIGVGGTFDYLSGKIKRAPKLLRQLGLEWLFRLIIQPQRIGRIFKAVIVFPFLVWQEKFFGRRFTNH